MTFESGIINFFDIRMRFQELRDGKSIAVTDVGVTFGQEFVDRAKTRFGIDLAVHWFDGKSFKKLSSTFGDGVVATQDELKRVFEGTTLQRDATIGGHPAAVYVGQIKNYAGQPVANGSMTYKHDSRADDLQQTVLVLIHPQVTLKLLPGPDGKPAIAQLVTFTMQDVKVTGSWHGPARLELIPHANAPAADLPVNKVVLGRHFIADLTLPYGAVAHDYLK